MQNWPKHIMKNKWQFSVLLLTLITSCVNSAHTVVIPYGKIKECDLAFRCGRGVVSHIVTAAETSHIYSHVGVVVNLNGEWMVIHAVPGERDLNTDFDGVKIDKLEQFFSPDRASRGCLIHVANMDSSTMSEICEKAMAAVKNSIAFDDRYDLDDSTKVYCTEFVWRLFKNQGIDLSEGKRRHVHTLNINNDVILPEHLVKYKGNKDYFMF